MNQSEIIKEIVSKTGVSEDICNKVVDAFQGEAGSALLSKLGGKDVDVAATASGIASKLNLSPDICQKVISAFMGLKSGGLSDALGGLLK